MTPPRGFDDDPRFTSGLRLTPAFGVQIGHGRYGHDVPAFGTAEHFALMTGSLDLDEIEHAGQHTEPLVGFAPIVLDPHGPAPEDLDQPARSRVNSKVLPSRRSLRAAGSTSLGRPLSGGLLPPAPRPGSPVSGVTVLPPLGTSATTTGGLRVKDVQQALAAQSRSATEETLRTGELARPFVGDGTLAEWTCLEDVPPPVSVDVFQRAVRAGLAIDDTESLKRLDDEPDVAASARGERRARSRRELRARERAASSPRSVTARRLAKGGVLAITALGVVSGATPQGLSAFGISKDGPATRNTVDFASALAPDNSAPDLTTAQLEQLRQASLAAHLRSELAEAKAADAVHAGIGAGTAVASLAAQQDAQMLAAREAARQRAIRDVINNPQAYAKILLGERGWGDQQFQCLNSLWNRESQWNYRATNASSGAYGIPQALPGSKMNTVGADWRTNPVTQIKWGLNYISSVYGTPCGAWAHSQATGWY